MHLSTITSTATTRRRLRRHRAVARALWHNFSKKNLLLTKDRLRWIKRTLTVHHSRDRNFLHKISGAMAQYHAEDAYPWRCPCNRLNKKTHVHCPQCKRHWTTGTRHSTQPAYAWHAEEEVSHWNQWESPAVGRQKQRPSRSKSLRSKKGKGKGAAGGQEQQQPSPFATPMAIPPWPSPDTGFAGGQPAIRAQASTASLGSSTTGPLQTPASDLLIAVRKQFPDMTKAPIEVREAVEKEEASNSQRIGADLHRTSSQINKATKQLNQLREARSRHREQWLRHLKDSITAWESQMKSFQEQQKQYIEQTNKAKAELSAARRNFADAQQARGIAVQCQSRNSRDPRAGGGSWRTGSHGSGPDQASSGLLEASSSHSQSQRCARHHGFRRRWSGWSTQVQKTAIIGAIWASSYAYSAHNWSDRSFHVNSGDEVECLRNSLHAPCDSGWRDGSIVEAYAMDEAWCAASNVPSLDHSTMCLILCHSIRWEERFHAIFCVYQACN